MAYDDTKEVKPKGTLKDPGKEKKGNKDKKVEQQAQKIYDNYSPLHPAGAPYSVEFIQAALEQGLNPKEIKSILNSGALFGTTVGQGSDSASTELLDYFTEHPDEIGALLDAVKSTSVGYDTYAEYIAQGGEPGAYRTPDQLLQEAVLGIGEAKAAYLAGTTYAKYIAEGNDPTSWYADRYRWMQEHSNSGSGGGGGTGQSFVGGFDVPGAGYDYNDLNQFGMGDVLSHFMQAQQNKALVEQSGAFFDTADLTAESEA